ncbi:hypothetical protein [Janthinobacterium sp. RB2R34]|uniref:hypothetical protein n=1 Tax=Janthinobacterium sp. RB2R34 TaxID=3424193 RepID=UPI003F276CCC
MTALPAALEPWALWLNLFAPDLAPAVGALLLRLHPLVGKLSTATLERGAEPAGIGNIVRRGHYERLLISEWAIADAEPDEFLRRAGSGELLFNGPEPAVHQRSLHSVALFDAGPAQLGEPRLAHLALFILLARRAQQAGAQFRWGIWQRPGVMFDDSGHDALRKLLRSRTLQPAPVDARQQWEAELGADLADCWLIGVSGEAPRQARNQVAIRRALGGNHLHVCVRQRRDQRTLQLELPAAPVAVRLLRKPFTPAALPGTIHHRDTRPSRAQAPRFSSGGKLVCVRQLDGSGIVYHVPQSASGKPGKYRILSVPAHGAILAAGVFKTTLSCITSADGTLKFHNFPGPLLSGKPILCERPPLEDFHAPPGMARWLEAFYLLANHTVKRYEHVVVLDTKRRLVCWQAVPPASPTAMPTVSFHHMLDDVIGIHHLGDSLYIGCAEGGGVQLYHWHSQNSSPSKMNRIAQAGSALLHGALKGEPDGHGGTLLAIKTGATQWWVGSHNKGETMDIDDGATVLGVAISSKHPKPGLVVLHPGRRRIEMRVGHVRHELATSPEPIQQASMDAASARIAWITAKSSTVVVRDLDGEQPLLQISCDGGADDADDAYE